MAKSHQECMTEMLNSIPMKASTDSPMKGVVGIFKNEDQLKTAAAQVKQKNVKAFDAFTPYPVHGLEDAMGIPRSFLPWVTFIAGLTGASAGLGLEYWTSAVDWPLNVGGKPFFSLPAFVPVMFELTVLFAGLATAGALFATCRIPNLKPQILHPDLTNNQFALFVSAEDPAYREADFTDLMKRAGAHEVRVI